MDYEKKYKEALERAKVIYQGSYKPDTAATIAETLQNVFPELRESEDERIKEALIEYFRWNVQQILSDFDNKEVLAWLEKQGKEDSSIQQAYEWGYTEGKRIEKKHWIEKQNFSEDYNSIDPQFGKPINKVEPKFKVGDWVVSPNGVYWHIDAIQNGRYEVTADTGQCGNWPLDTNIYRLWTIQDAKDGDVLSNGKMIVIFKHFEEPSYRQHIVAYIGLDIIGNIQITDDTWNLGIDKTKPATKEQRDLLFQKIKEVGYEWDAEKKELEKQGEQRAAWSEKDEKILKAIHNSVDVECLSKNELDYVVMVDWFNALKDRVQPKQEWSEEDATHYNRILKELNLQKEMPINASVIKEVKSDIIWFKSLRPQNTWKPSDEQITVLELASKYERVFTPKQIDILIGLKEQLKKLKGE